MRLKAIGFRLLEVWESRRAFRYQTQLVDISQVTIQRKEAYLGLGRKEKRRFELLASQAKSSAQSLIENCYSSRSCFNERRRSPQAF